jgi:F420-dependent oxidoreductase-like protein
LGASGPQVVEGWYGALYGSPLRRTREYVEIIRAILGREQPLEYHGQYYDIPVREGTGMGKPLKLMVHPLRARVPIYLGAIGPRNVALAAEIADGWLPIFFSPERMDLFRSPLQEGFSRAASAKPSFDIAPIVNVQLGDDVQACRNAVKPTLALYIGGMGAKGRNFYYNLACRYGYQAEAEKIQDAFLNSRKAEAIRAVPDALVDEVALCGPKERISERLALWRASGATTLICATSDTAALRAMAELVL